MIEYCSQAGRVGRDKAEGKRFKKKTVKVKSFEDFIEPMPSFSPKR